MILGKINDERSVICQRKYNKYKKCPKIATPFVYYIYFLFILPISTSHEPESHFYLQSL